MAAPLAATQAVIPVTKAVEAASKVLTGDLVVFRGKVHRKREVVFYGPDTTPKTGALRKHTQEILEPIDVELHINPVTIGLAGVGAGVVGLVGYVAWHGLSIPAPLGGAIGLIPGLKDSPFWSQEALRAQWKLYCRRRGGTPEERAACLLTGLERAGQGTPPPASPSEPIPPPPPAPGTTAEDRAKEFCYLTADLVPWPGNYAAALVCFARFGPR